LYLFAHSRDPDLEVILIPYMKSLLLSVAGQITPRVVGSSKRSRFSACFLLTLRRGACEKTGEGPKTCFEGIGSSAGQHQLRIPYLLGRSVLSQYSAIGRQPGYLLEAHGLCAPPRSRFALLAAHTGMRILQAHSPETLAMNAPYTAS
jgi:hypothetical protein